MKQGINQQHFAGMRKSRTRGVGLKGDLDGFRASKKVWTCVACLMERRDSPYRKPYTRATPSPCHACKKSAYVYSASQSEADRYAQLRKTRGITGLKHPPESLPIRSFTTNGELVTLRNYTADFRYQNSTQQWVYEDHKPHNRLTELQKLIHTLVWHQNGIDVLITWYTGRGKSRRINQAWSSELR